MTQAEQLQKIHDFHVQKVFHPTSPQRVGFLYKGFDGSKFGMKKTEFVKNTSQSA
jgi:hypothetical protein